MIELASELLMIMRLKEHKEGDQKKYVLTKEQLIEFVMKYNKVLERVNDEY